MFLYTNPLSHVRLGKVNEVGMRRGSWNVKWHFVKSPFWCGVYFGFGICSNFREPKCRYISVSAKLRFRSFTNDDTIRF
jgi:hypothetical protein